MKDMTDPSPILAALVEKGCLPGQSNHAIADYIRSWLEDKGIHVAIIPGPEGDRVNLLATIGPRDVPGILLSGHMDVVPVEGQAWSSPPFCLTECHGRLIGRGASDMKGFLACMMAAVPLFCAADLKRPVHLAFSYDEEIGCRGVPHLIARLPDLVAMPMAAIIGEPSNLQPVLSHKGKLAIEISLDGRAAHSSNPDAGLNALYAAAELVRTVEHAAHAQALHGLRDPRFVPPHSTLVAGVLHAGTAVNIIPDRAILQLETRVVPGDDADALLRPILARTDELLFQGRVAGVNIRELARYPALPPDAGDLAGLVSSWTGKPMIPAVSYGTEAGLFHAAGIPSVICGPGSIDRAHRPNEYILTEELSECMAMLSKLAAHMSQ